QISEVFDGDEPHRPGGCIAQAWSVAEVLRVALEETGTEQKREARCTGIARDATATTAFTAETARRTRPKMTAAD
ncbi:MAG: amylo-alpha-1,6-glucosidase, partial [Acidobacteriota bacterium]